MHRHLKQTAIIALWVGLIVAGSACTAQQPVPPEAPTPPVITSAVQIRLIPAAEGTPVAGRRLVLCQIVEEAGEPYVCTLAQDQALRASEAGIVELPRLRLGRYLVLYDSGMADFDEVVAAWQGRTLHLEDWLWLRDAFLPTVGGLTVPVPRGAAPGVPLADYVLRAWLVDESPFIAAYTIVGGRVEPLVIQPEADDAGSFEVEVVAPNVAHLVENRARLGSLSSEEASQLDPDLVSRWGAFLTGDDGQYREGDRLAIEALRAGELHRIENTHIGGVESYGDMLIMRPGYIATDLQTGVRGPVAWLDAPTGDVIEASTGYQLNVRDDFGIRTEAGPAGEQFYHYGFSYYRPWGRILPDPVVIMITNFYLYGALHVETNIAAYDAAAETFGGDMQNILWDGGTSSLVKRWRPNGRVAPIMFLPDSGTVDVRRDRFAQAVESGQVQVDRESVRAFLASDYNRSLNYDVYPDEETVVQALLTPYRNGPGFNDMEALIILDATYNRSQPLTIEISERLRSGFMVPRRNTGQVLIAPEEVAIVILGYPGALNSRWAHEMAHVVEFEAAQYTFEGRPEGGSRCEPLKYMLEYMWWVQRYPQDAPDWDWMPINSGLTLSRLLTDTYHNSGC